MMYGYDRREDPPGRVGASPSARTAMPARLESRPVEKGTKDPSYPAWILAGTTVLPGPVNQLTLQLLNAELFQFQFDGVYARLVRYVFFGDDGSGNTWRDEILFSYTGIAAVAVVSSLNLLGAPGARTWAVNVGQVGLTIAGGPPVHTLSWYTAEFVL